MNPIAQATLPPSTSYRIIPLSQNQVALVDASEHPKISGINWYAVWNPDICGFYASGRVGNKTVYMHRMIMETPKGMQVDHRCIYCTLDNRRSNMRNVTRSQNQMNRRRQSNNTSGYKGVSLFKRTGRYRAYIMVDGKETHLGYYKTAEEAYAVYCAAVIRIHGEFARLI